MMIRGVARRKMVTHLLFLMGFPLTIVDHCCLMMTIDGLGRILILMMEMTIIAIMMMIMIMRIMIMIWW